MRVRLYTRDGGYVTTAHIPPFDPAPEVILFGSRVFVKAATSQVDGDGQLHYRYEEGHAVSIDPRGQES